MNSRRKGKEGELSLARKLREYGYDCRRGGRNMKRDETNGRFQKSENIFDIRGEVVYCYSEAGELLFFTDASLAKEIGTYSWGKLANGYSAGIIAGQEVATHRFLTNAKPGEIVDHINRDKKDNRLCNLRICNKSENAYNSKRRVTNKSGKTGVYWRKDTLKWAAEIKHLGKKYCLGCFDNFEDASKARDIAEQKIMKEYRPRA